MDDNIQKCGSRQVAAGLLALGVFLGGFFRGIFITGPKWTVIL